VKAAGSPKVLVTFVLLTSRSACGNFFVLFRIYIVFYMLDISGALYVLTLRMALGCTTVAVLGLKLWPQLTNEHYHSAGTHSACVMHLLLAYQLRCTPGVAQNGSKEGFGLPTRSLEDSATFCSAVSMQIISKPQCFLAKCGEVQKNLLKIYKFNKRKNNFAAA
jgi:hypothetical protein